MNGIYKEFIKNGIDHTRNSIMYVVHRSEKFTMKQKQMSKNRQILKHMNNNKNLVESTDVYFVSVLTLTESNRCERIFDTKKEPRNMI